MNAARAVGAHIRLWSNPTDLLDPDLQASPAGPSSIEESIMGRMYIDCREFPSEMSCTVAICADSEGELMEAAVQHAVAVHGHHDSPEFREQIRTLFKKGTAPLQAPSQSTT